MTENSRIEKPEVPSVGPATAGRGDDVQDRGEVLPDSAAGQERGEGPAEDDEDRGRYVEGSYGKAGREAGHRRGAGEGQYIEGEYGKAGSESARKTGQGEETQTGRFTEADYGSAGNVAPRSGEHGAGQYAKGDYGSGGTVKPKDKET
ncbi:hypothetical protein IV500_03545 [Paeniglutamicibacter antarcticus]|uniref:Uncharacterized protein n=1 Tax=Arthrobacter terrae TaxID=2935737 RepID=A0A931CLR9_9MICC|nr:hypothetical protein [Arthrobacter terrae]MBG0738500.1 hypothetical protein [Arthrobacter terrae]